MNYYDIINQAIELVVVDAGNGLCFLEPRYKEALRIAGLLDHDEVISEEELIEAIKLEVEKRNIMNNKMNIIAAWIAKTIEEVVDPAITQEENQLMLNLLNYLERDKQVKEKEEELEVKEKELEVKATLPTNINFAKKKADE
jgi:hypothetical protein